MKKTVLIVEDEMDMRIFISTLLETSGYRPVMTRDGREGLEDREGRRQRGRGSTVRRTLARAPGGRGILTHETSVATCSENKR